MNAIRKAIDDDDNLLGLEMCLLQLMLFQAQSYDTLGMHSGHERHVHERIEYNWLCLYGEKKYGNCIMLINASTEKWTST